MWKSIEIFYILTVCNVCVTSEGDSKLLSFVQLFRHGARTPILFYKDDPYKDSSHWDGIEEGQLTKEGKQQLVELGQYIRHRYADFLPKTYNDKFFKVTSVSSRRNLESMEKFLEGLYPDLADPKSAIKVEDVVLRAFLYPTYILQYFKLVATNKELRSFIDENKDIFRYLREKAKIGKPIPEGLFNSYVVYDILSIEAGRNLTLPEWTKSVFPEMITVMAKTFSKTMCYNEEMQKTGSGLFLNSIIKHFDILTDRPTDQKVLLYSAHDINVMCLLNTFGVYKQFDYQVPAFASSVILELRERDGKRFINGYYKPDQTLHPITLKGCQFDCDYEEFKMLMKDVRLDKWEFVKMNLDTVSKSLLNREFSIDSSFYKILTNGIF
nr:unnamed protein product [Callosobruchus analis]